MDDIVLQDKSSLLRKVEVFPLDIRKYHSFTDERVFRNIEQTSTRLKGLKVGHLTPTPMMNGVGEILQSLVPLMNNLGVISDWYTIAPEKNIVQLTQNIYNSLQGGKWRFDSRSHSIFLEHNKRIAEEIELLDIDCWIIHDPQPCLVSAGINIFRNAIWHCHLDTSTPNKTVWNYLNRYLKEYDRLVFSLQDYMTCSIPPEKVRFIQPAIDPLNPKNQHLPVDKAKSVLSRLGIDPGRPLISQIARFDLWKDPIGVVEAYYLAKQQVIGLQLALVGTLTEQDDPEAAGVYKQVIEYCGEDPDIHLFINPDQIKDLEINAFQTASEIIIQKSIREGFGLTVAEALWKGTAVIGGNCGGIRTQIEDGVNGYLVNTPKECATRIIELIQDEALRNQLGTEGKKVVRRHHLIPRLLRDYLALIEEVVLGV
ncbi:MAG: glycosyltransferase [Verrucomicrobiales bacterium]|nr:glycosyltransferase [Nitrospinaceae bacterium]